MNYLKNYIVLFLVISTILSCASTQRVVNYDNDIKIFGTISKMFVAMQENDTIALNSIFIEEVKFQTVFLDSKKVTSATKSEFYNSLDYLKNEKIKWNEEILLFDKVYQDSNYVSVVTPYKFYLKDSILHCGINNFQMLKNNNKWKIISITDTRKSNCK